MLLSPVSPSPSLIFKTSATTSGDVKPPDLTTSRIQLFKHSFVQLSWLQAYIATVISFAVPKSLILMLASSFWGGYTDFVVRIYLKLTPNAKPAYHPTTKTINPPQSDRGRVEKKSGKRR